MNDYEIAEIQSIIGIDETNINKHSYANNFLENVYLIMSIC